MNPPIPYAAFLIFMLYASLLISNFMLKEKAEPARRKRKELTPADRGVGLLGIECFTPFALYFLLPFS